MALRPGKIKEMLSALSDPAAIWSNSLPPRFPGHSAALSATGRICHVPEPARPEACLADDGSGKNDKLIAFLLHERETMKGPDPTSSSVLCLLPATGSGDRRFAPGLKVLMHHGLGRLSGQDFEKAAEKADVVITTYSHTPRGMKKSLMPYPGVT